MKVAVQRVLVVVAVVCVALVLFFFDPASVPFYPKCPFHMLTGLDCPGCGSLRAMHQLLHGDWAAAFHLNPLFVLALPVLGVVLWRNARRK